MRTGRNGAALAAAAMAALAGCRTEAPMTSKANRMEGTVHVVRDSVVESDLEVTGTAAPRLSADLSTRLMGRILSISVKEGDVVHPGQLLLRVDGSDLAARSEGVASAMAASSSQLELAETQVRRMRALHADSAVPRSALDQAEAELQRARAGVAQVRSQEGELRSIQGYSRIASPFTGRVVARLVDPGMMSSPGQPLLRVEDASILRVSAATTASTAQALLPGTRVKARIDGREAVARIEGVVPSGVGNLAMVNALVDNPDGVYPSGTVATLYLPRGTRTVRLVPRECVEQEGDLVGVWARTPQGDVRRWIRVGDAVGPFFELISGLAAGDTLIEPASRMAGN